MSFQYPPKPPSLWSKFKSYYTPTYPSSDTKSDSFSVFSSDSDASSISSANSISRLQAENDPANPPKSRQPKPRYCNGRFTKRQFICLHVSVFSFILAIILIPIFYFVIIPAIIRSRIRNTPFGDMNISRMDIQSFLHDGLNYGLTAEIPEQLPIPIKANLGEGTWQIYRLDPSKDSSEEVDRSQTPLLKLGTPSFSINLAQPIIDVDGGMQILGLNDLNALVRDVCQDHGTDVKLIAIGKLDISVAGITWYKNFELEKVMEMGKLKMDMIELWNRIPPFIKSEFGRKLTTTPQDPSVVEGMPEPNDGGIIRSLLPGLPPIALNKLDIAMSDNGPTISMGLTFQNPTVIAMTLPPTTFTISAESVPLAQVALQGFSLTRGVTSINVTTSVTIPQTSKSDIPRAVYRLAAKLLGQEFIEFKNPSAVDPTGATFDATQPPTLSILGPLTIQSAEFAEKITQPLVLYLPIRQLLDAFGIVKLKDMLTVDGIREIMTRASFNASILATHMDIPLSGDFPVIFPLPSRIDFPYTTSLSIYANNVQSLSITLHSITVVTTSEKMTLSTRVTVYPNNTIPAAESLKTVTDKMLVQEVPATVSVGDISFRTSDTNQTFAWSETLLRDLLLAVPLPPLSIDQLLSAMTNNGEALPAQLHDLVLNQLTNQPGFNAVADFTLKYPVAIPRISMALGYASALISLDEIDLVKVGLNNGIEMELGQTKKPVNVDAVIERLDEPKMVVLGTKVNSLVNKLLEGITVIPKVNVSGPTLANTSSTNLPAVVVSGVTFGVSTTTNFITFSKVRIPLKLDKLIPLFAKLANNVIKTTVDSSTSSLVKVSSASLDVQSGSKILVGVDSVLNNPLNASVSIGKLGVLVSLDQSRIAKIEVDPIKFGKGTSNLKLGVSMDILGNGNAEAEGKVKELLEGAIDIFFFSGSTERTLPNLGIGELVLASPNSNPQAIINQFQKIQISIPTSYVLSLLQQSPSKSVIDMSALIPTMEKIKSMAIPTLHSANVKTLPSKSLSLDASLSYQNPIPISVNVGYISTTLQIQNTPILSVSIRNVKLSHASGTLSPQVLIKFHSNPNAPELVSNIVDQIMGSGKISHKLSLSETLIGSNENSVMTLLRRSDVKVPVHMVDMKPIVDEMITKALSLVPSELSVQSIQDQLKLRLQSAKIETLPERNLRVDGSLEFENPLKNVSINIDMGFIGFGLGLNGATVGNARLEPLKLSLSPLSPRSTISTSLNVQFTNPLSPQHLNLMQSHVSKLVDQLITGKPLSTVFKVSDMLFGHTRDDAVDTLSRVVVEVEGTKIIKSSKPLFDFPGLLEQTMNRMFDVNGNNLGLTSTGFKLEMDVPFMAIGNVRLALDNVKLAARPGSVVEVSVVPRLEMNPNIEVRIGWINIGMLLDGTEVGQVAVNGLSISSKSSNVNAVSALISLKENDEAMIKIGQVVTNMIEAFKNEQHVSPGSFAISQCQLGASAKPNDVIAVLQTVALTSPLQPVLKPVVRYADITISRLIDTVQNRQILVVERDTVRLTFSESFEAILKGVQMKTANDKRLQLGIQGTIKLPLSIEIDIPVVVCDLGVKQVLGAVALGVNGLRLTGNGNTKDLNLDISIGLVNDSDELADLVAELVKTVTEKNQIENDISVSLSNFEFGASNQPGDLISTFRSVIVSIPASPLQKIINPLLRDAMKLVNGVLGDLARVKVEVIRDGQNSKKVNGWKMTLNQNFAVTLSKLTATVSDGKLVTGTVGLQMNINVPINIGLDIGFLEGGLKLNGVDIVTAKLNGIKMDVKGGTTSTGNFDLGFGLIIRDSQELSSQIATILSAVMNDINTIPSTKVGLSSPVIGSADVPAHRITLLRKVSMDFEVTEIFKNVLKSLMPSSFDVIELVNMFGVNVRDLRLKSENIGNDGTGLDAKFVARFENLFPVSIDIGYSRVIAGLDGVGVAEITVGGLKIGQNSVNELEMNTLVRFMDGSREQDKVATVVDKVLKRLVSIIERGNSTNGDGLMESVSVSGIQFGSNSQQQNVIQMLAQSRIGMSLDKIVNVKIIDYVLSLIGLTRQELNFDNTSKLLQKVNIERAHLDAAGESKVGKKVVFDLQASVELSLSAFVDIGYFGVSVDLNDFGLANMAIPGLKVVSDSQSKRVRLSMKAEIELSEEEKSQNGVALIVKQIVDSGTTNAVGKVSNIRIGASRERTTGLFSKVAVTASPFDGIIKKLKPVISDLMNRVSELIQIQNVDMTFVDSNTMGCGVTVDIVGFEMLNTVSAKIGFAQLDAHINDVQTATTRVSNIVLEKSRVSMSMMMTFAITDNALNVIGSVSDIVGSLLFKLPIAPMPIQFAPQGARFGLNANELFSIASKVKVPLDVGRYIPDAAKWYNSSTPFFIADVQVDNVPEGLDAKVKIDNKLPIPLSVQIPSASARLYHAGKQGQAIVDIFATEFLIQPGKPVQFRLLIAPIKPNIYDALKVAVPRLLSLRESYSKDVHLGGYIVHTTSDPKTATPDQSFIPFKQSRWFTPDLFFFKPLHLRPRIVNPFKNGLGMDIGVSFNNTGPLHLNIGQIDFKLVSRKDDPNKMLSIGTLSTKEPVVVGNFLERKGWNDLTAQLRLDLKIWQIPRLLGDLITRADEFGFSVQMKSVDGKSDLDWVEDILEKLPKYVLAEFWKVILGIWSESTIKLFGKNPDPVTLDAPSNSTALQNEVEKPKTIQKRRIRRGLKSSPVVITKRQDNLTSQDVEVRNIINHELSDVVRERQILRDLDETVVKIDWSRIEAIN